MEKEMINEVEEMVTTPTVEVAEDVVEEAAVEAPVIKKAPRPDRRGAKRDDRQPRRNDRDREKEFEEQVVVINRVTKVVKGGRKFRFSALVVVGDKKGRVGIGTGKANEVPDAIKKAIEDAKKNVFKVKIVGTTIPHAIDGRYGAGHVFMKPASEGTGVIAGGPVRAVLELAGITDVLSKCLGSRTPINMVRATVQGLQSLKTLDEVAKIRDLKPEEVRK